ncbi:MAG: transketolase [Bacteroidia bacterium]|nr:transketolase [Bacteroidia bacterium]MDG1746876.1 transketolase [Bacteroidia bacterium]
MTDIQHLPEIARQVRRDILRMVHRVSSGHPGGSLGCADYLTALYFQYMNHNPENFDPKGNGEDVFVMSNGHISPVFYSVLARSGYFPVDELNTFRLLNTRLQGHPTTHEGLPGVRVATGSLGQGLSVAVGFALQKKLDGDKSRVFALTGDGELQEGQIWEALMFAAHHKVDNLIVAVDFNKQQIDGSTGDVLGITEVKSRFASFGWTTLEMDGNDWDDIHRLLPNAIDQLGCEKPVVIIMKTEMGQGVDFMMGTHAWHGKAPNDEQLENALNQLPETQFGDY